MRHDNCIIYNKKIKVLSDFHSLLFVFYIIFTCTAGAQWVSSPEKNTLLATNCYNPINISSVGDQIGGLFIFWEDNTSGFQGNISFLHVNGDGIVSFRSDGKKISSSGSSNPVCTSGPPNSAYVVWKEKGFGSEDRLKAQRVSSAGNLLWNQNGVNLTSAVNQVGDYSASSDNSGKLFISYAHKENINENYLIKLQVLSADGKKLFPDGLTAAHSENKISNVTSVADGNGNVNLFWLESISGKTVLMGNSLDLKGKSRWGLKPVQLSNPLQNVFSFNARMYGSSVYIVWQTQKTDKDIFHQLINNDGKPVWQRNGLQVLPQRGNQINPQSYINGEKIYLTWTDDNDGDRNILMQKYAKSGSYLWHRNGVPVIKLKGDQFGQKILGDGKTGTLVTWIDRRSTSLHGNIYAQRINNEGVLQWDSLGVKVASSRNTEKSYISVIPDVTGGAVVIFREKRAGRNEIFGQKIFNTGTFTSQIIAFNSELTGDSVKISWYSANEAGSSKFSIERTSQSDASSDIWKKVHEVYSDGKAAAKYYEFYDKPDIQGTIYYRVVHSDNKGNIQPSDLSKINYLGDQTGIFISQNSPNPFKEKTVINIYLPEAAEIKIEFFDSHIEKIKEIEKSLPAGLNEIEFLAEGLTPGIYFYKVHAEDFVDVKKMVLAN